MYRALVDRDSGFEGVFVVGVRTTGIFCRPTCPARKPKRENVEFFDATAQAIASGYRPCKRCKPLQPAGDTPSWAKALLADVDGDPGRRWSDQDLRDRSLDPVRVRRWFKTQHGVTFHGYVRARRLGRALGRIHTGEDLTDTAYDVGYESPSAFRDAFTRQFGDTPGRSRDTAPAMMTRFATPLGPVVAAATDNGICLLEFADRRELESQIQRVHQWLGVRVAPGRHPHLEQLQTELTEYFEGKRKAFRVPVVTPGTPFQESVWAELNRIPYGQTRSYEEMARRIQRPGAQRAVGKANGDNRIAIVIPCHRVIRADGTLSGYAGGLWRKKKLLDLEQGR